MIKYRRYTALLLAALVALSGTAGCAQPNSAAESAASAETAAGNAAAEGDGGQDAGAEASLYFSHVPWNGNGDNRGVSQQI